MPQVLIKITGRVQGVCFRSNAKRIAQELEITGYAKNLYDDSVEILAQGEEDRLKEFIDWCKVGPVHAKVDGISVSWNTQNNTSETFKII